MTIFGTERLIAREWRPEEDAEAAFEMYGDPEVVRYLGRTAQPEPSVEAVRSKLEERMARQAALGDGSGAWALEEKSTGEVVGTILVKRLPDGEGNPTEDFEVGWHLRRRSWGMGYASEAARAALVYAQETLGLDKIHAVLYRENVRSAKVAERIGMKHVGATDRYYGVEVELYEMDLGEGR